MGQCLPLSHTSQASGLQAAQWFDFLHLIRWPRPQAVTPASGKGQNQEHHTLILLLIPSLHLKVITELTVQLQYLGLEGPGKIFFYA